MAGSTLPIVPLPATTVLLPGVTLRIPLQGRNDIAAVLANIYSKASTPQPEATAVTVGCVPINSPYLSPGGRKLLEDGSKKPRKSYATDPSQATAKDLFKFGTLAKVSGVQGRRQGELALVVEGVSRFSIDKVVQEKPFLDATITTHEEQEINELDADLRNSFLQLKQLSRELLALVRLSSLLPSRATPNLSPLLARRLELYIVRKDLQEAGVLADFMTNIIDCTHEEKLQILASLSAKERVQKAVEILQRNVANIQAKNKISVTTASVSQDDSDQLSRLREQALIRRLGGGMPGGAGNRSQDAEEPNEIDELRKRLDEAKLSTEAQKVADRELKRLQKMNPAQAEYQVCRTYLENLTEIPWGRVTEDKLDVSTLSRARKQLDDDHYGLDRIKKRLLEYLAVLKLKQAVNADLQGKIDAINAEAEKSQPAAEAKDKEADAAGQEVVRQRTQSIEELKLRHSKRLVDKSPILLLVGPPGTGKTSLAKSVATALGRKFHRISLGGVRDEAEIRGHRRTYVAAMPGLIVSGLKKVGVANPVFLLDEIDKVGTSSIHGDPSAAMLEVLDPEQNSTFTDHYVNIPIDLSKVLFIATANSLDTIPAPLLDRMETIELSGYTTLEKRHIATRHLIPKQITTNGLDSADVAMSSEVIDKIITAYTREAGVRNLEREIGSVCRSKAVQYADAADKSSGTIYNPEVKLEQLEDILGVERYEEELAASESRPGVVTGLVAYSTGAQGSILFIEVVDVVGNGGVKLTGKLGDVLKESVEVALTWVKAHAYDLGITHDPTEDIMKNRSVHVHCPSGAIPKDGPSAGLAHTVALTSLFSSRSVPPSLAMTGEVSLRGKVLPVGGIKEKLIGAMTAGCKKVLLPVGNRKDVKDLPDEVKQGLEIVHVAHIWEALRQVWPDAHWPGERTWSNLESRL